MRSQLGWTLLLALVPACVDKGPGDPGPQIDPTYIAEHLLEAPPASIPNRLDAMFGDAVIYLGNDLVDTSVDPGQKVVIHHYWQILKPPGAQWRIFAHLRGPAGDFLNADLTDMRTGYPAAKWEAGMVIRDEQSFVVDKFWKSATATLVVGLFQQGKHKLTDRMEVTGEGVVDRALPVATLQVDLSKAPPPPGNIALKKAPGPIAIDGVANEQGWTNAAVQTSFTSCEGSAPEMPWSTTAKLTWDDQYLYVFVAAEDPDVHSDFVKQDDHLWEQDVIEVFIDADGNRRGYVELQVNPRDTHFDTWFAGVRPNRDDSFDSGMISKVVVKGTVDSRADGDVGWDLELAIPHAAVLGKDPKMKVHVPPLPGDTWRLNVVRGDVAVGGKNGILRAATWNPITCDDFHALDRMLTVQFASATGELKPAETPELAAPGADGGVPEVGADAGPAPMPTLRAPVRPVAPPP